MKRTLAAIGFVPLLLVACKGGGGVDDSASTDDSQVVDDSGGGGDDSGGGGDDTGGGGDDTGGGGGESWSFVGAELAGDCDDYGLFNTVVETMTFDLDRVSGSAFSISGTASVFVELNGEARDLAVEMSCSQTSSDFDCAGNGDTSDSYTVNSLTGSFNGDSAELDVETGVNDRGVPFCTDHSSMSGARD